MGNCNFHSAENSTSLAPRRKRPSGWRAALDVRSPQFARTWCATIEMIHIWGSSFFNLESLVWLDEFAAFQNDAVETDFRREVGRDEFRQGNHKVECCLRIGSQSRFVFRAPNHPAGHLSHHLALLIEEEANGAQPLNVLSGLVFHRQRQDGLLSGDLTGGSISASCPETSKGQSSGAAAKKKLASSIDTSPKKKRSLVSRAGSSRASNSVGGRFHGEKARAEFSSWLTWTALAPKAFGVGCECSARRQAGPCARSRILSELGRSK